MESLAGPRLDYWVAKARGAREISCITIAGTPFWAIELDGQRYSAGCAFGTLPGYSPSTDYELAEPLIHDHYVALNRDRRSGKWMAVIAEADEGMAPWLATGETMLIAAMRVIVLKLFGGKEPAPTTETVTGSQ